MQKKKGVRIEKLMRNGRLKNEISKTKRKLVTKTIDGGENIKKKDEVEMQKKNKELRI